MSTFIFLMWLMHRALGPAVSPSAHVAILILFAFTLPWMVIGFWNATIGFIICRFVREPLALVVPDALHANSSAPITLSTALLLCIRNETPERLERNIEVMLAGLKGPEIAPHIHLYVLSDTDNQQIGEQEQACFDAMQSRWTPSIAITYRRRTDNKGYKAGNIADFCERWGSQHDIAITLDADSFMTGTAIKRLIRIMQATPTLGILQGLVVGLPSTSGFTRLFQYGMRLGMRSYTMGSAWWQSDCGPYWGHNAAIRLAPFIAHCELPSLPGPNGTTRHILSHDQIEAVLMRKAGFDVRVIPQEDESWEENPPTLVEYIRRDLRWCEGNLQYVHLLRLPGLLFMSRYQLCVAIFMFLGSPAWIALLTLGIASACFSADPSQIMQGSYGVVLMIATLLMWYLPKIAGAADVISRASERKRFGGGWRFVTGFTLEMIFSILMTPITWLNHTMFMTGLVFGRKAGWGAQARDDHSIPLSTAIKQFWPHTVLGLAGVFGLLVSHPQLLPYSFFALGGLVLSVPIAVLTSLPIFGATLIRHRLLSLPEEIDPPEALKSLHLRALS
ncbi:MAG: glucans biosynthesis glucosyltransferase [Pseudomonadota bacterium]